MPDKFSLKKKITIHAPASKVWQALIDPAMIKQYFFGVDATGEWKEGSTVTYKGEWKGKPYEGRSKIIKIEPGKILKHSYWSEASGLQDVPENYQIVTYRLTAANGNTVLDLTEENLATEKMKELSDQTWGMVFDNLKKLLEKN